MYSQAWLDRKEHFDRVFWNEEEGIWSDRVVGSNQHLPGFYASSITPLYLSMIANSSNVIRETIVLRTLTRLGVFDYRGGLPTSLNRTSEQWDFPNACMGSSAMVSCSSMVQFKYCFTSRGSSSTGYNMAEVYLRWVVEVQRKHV